MYSNGIATIYRLLNGKYTRLRLPCFWSGRSNASTGKIGETESDTVSVYLPRVLPCTPQKDLIVKGSVTLDVDNTTDEAQSASLKSLFDTYDVHTIMSCKVCDYGSAAMRHTELEVK